ncbi:flagellar hook-length control protein FliK [Yersinia aleksiciae]|uniref:Flagellar hook-length control protein FliK n=1 Tax=Yersinia aleksiciae TaxID=263819 RepID=A0ABN4HC20_YERAE|nr:flagellar hook-length control protein FliK [Yersinia aleksiciae]AKP33095.1 flagellar hook-length control protein FliK [Yersinia aleksiciae]CFQ48705.1 flagellar hook-length control protein FliK [Yersinia aleksiciae]
MITLSGFTQAGSQLASEAKMGETPIMGSADEGELNPLTTFDDALSQVWQPHQPVSLRPSVVMDLIVRFDGKGDDVTMLPPTDEQNQQLLNVLLQGYGQNPPPLTIAAFPRPESVAESHLMEKPAPVVMPEKSSPLMDLLKSIGPRLNVTVPLAATRESQLLNPMLTEGGIAMMSSAASHIANSPHEAAAAPRMESQLTLANSQKEWPQQLRTVLGDRLQMQVENKVQHATIRLDPPDMGKIDISLHMEGGKLQVHINAGQGDVFRALQQTSAELRQMLLGQNTQVVEVQISANSQQQQQQRQQQHQQQQEDILAAQHIETQGNKSADDGTLLITV